MLAGVLPITGGAFCIGTRRRRRRVVALEEPRTDVLMVGRFDTFGYIAIVSGSMIVSWRSGHDLTQFVFVKRGTDAMTWPEND